MNTNHYGIKGVVELMSKKDDNFKLKLLLVDNVCSKCNYYHEDLSVCGATVLPIGRAIQNNLEGRGLCKDIKDYVIMMKEQGNE